MSLARVFMWYSKCSDLRGALGSGSAKMSGKSCWQRHAGGMHGYADGREVIQRATKDSVGLMIYGMRGQAVENDCPRWQNRGRVFSGSGRGVQIAARVFSFPARAFKRRAGVFRPPEGVFRGYSGVFGSPKVYSGFWQCEKVWVFPIRRERKVGSSSRIKTLLR